MKIMMNNIMIKVMEERINPDTELMEQVQKYNATEITTTKYSSRSTHEKGSYKLSTFIEWRGKMYRSQNFNYTVN